MKIPLLGSVHGLDDTPHGVLRSTCAETRRTASFVIRANWGERGERGLELKREAEGKVGGWEGETWRETRTRPDRYRGVRAGCSEDQLYQMASPRRVLSPRPAPHHTGQAQLEQTARGHMAGCPTGPSLGRPRREGRVPGAVSPGRARAGCPPQRAGLRPSGRGRPSVPSAPRNPAGEETLGARVPARRGGARPGPGERLPRPGRRRPAPRAARGANLGTAAGEGGRAAEFAGSAAVGPAGGAKLGYLRAPARSGLQ